TPRFENASATPAAIAAVTAIVRRLRIMLHLLGDRGLPLAIRARGLISMDCNRRTGKPPRRRLQIRRALPRNGNSAGRVSRGWDACRRGVPEAHKPPESVGDRAAEEIVRGGGEAVRLVDARRILGQVAAAGGEGTGPRAAADLL